MMYIPLNSAILVGIYMYNRTANRPIPQTMTQLYIELSLTLLKRHLGEDNPLVNELSQRLEDLPPELYQPFYALAKLAFEGLKKKEVVFREIPDSCEHFGFMNSPTDLYLGQKVSMSCSFLHLTLQEFLAAFYISQLSPSDQKCVFEEFCVRWVGWDVVWRFVAGLTGFSGIGWEVVEARRGRDENCKILPFFTRCLYEAQEKVDFDSVLGLKKAVFLIAAESNFYESTALDFYTVGYCIANSKCMWKLDISRVHLGDTFVEMLKHGLRSGKSPPCRESGHAKILVLKIGIDNYNTESTAAALDQLADIIPLMTNLRHLNIIGNGGYYGAPGAEGEFVKLFHALSQLKNLQELTMIRTMIGCTDVEALSHLISPSSSLKELSIGNELTMMSDTCKELMFKTVLSPSSLESVCFCEVDWTDEAKKLLEKNKNIKELVQWFNNYYVWQRERYSSSKIIYEALQKNSYLKKLRVNLIYIRIYRTRRY